MDQSEAPVLDALAAYQAAGQLGFCPPGHKQGRGVDRRTAEVMGESVFRADVLATGGLDSRLDTGKVLRRAEDLMAEAVHADYTFFSTCGSSLSVKAAMLAVAGPGEKLLIGRDAHKSVISGLVLAGIEPVWVDPSWDAERHLAHPPGPESFAEAFEQHPDARGALVTSPTPYGTCADLVAVAQLCHDRGRPVIVDEAWGAHLPFHPDLPKWAMDAGADVCITSVHKMGAGLEQGSVFHHQGELVGIGTLQSRADLFNTTSPSVLLYAALDGWRRHMVQDGHRLLAAALELAQETRQRIAAIDGLHVNGREDFCGPGRAFDLDPLQIVIDISDLGPSGYQAGDWMRSEHGVNLHLCDHRRISAQLTFSDSRETVDVLLAGLTDLSRKADSFPPAPRVDIPDPATLRLEQAMRPRDAYFGSVSKIPAAEAEGRVAAQMLTPYPPGIPAVLPGERLNKAVIDYLRSGVEAGMMIPETGDLTTISVVEEAT